MPSGKTIIEIGSGPTCLTQSILKQYPNVFAIEKDPRCVTVLHDLFPQVTVLEGDALKYKISDIGDASRWVVANLPYNIATPLIINWIHERFHSPEAVEGAVVMVQKEVAQRFTATVGTKNYGRLSVLAQGIADIEILFDVPPRVFSPPPKVTSSIIKFTFKSPEFSDIKKLEDVTRMAFGQRRKMIRTSLKPYLEQIECDPTVRGDQVTPEQFYKIS